MHTWRSIQLLVDVEFADYVFYNPLLVIRVKNNEIRTDRQMFRLSPQNSRADRVEGTKHDPFNGLIGQKGFDAGLHLFRGFIGECHCEDLPWSDSFDRDEIGDPLCQYPRLTGPRSCHH